MMMRKIGLAKDRLAMHWRIRRMVWQSELVSMLGSISRRGSRSSEDLPRIKVIRVSGKKLVRIR